MTTTIFIVLSSWPRSLREFTWFILWIYSSTNQPPTLRPSHLTWAVSQPVIGSYRLQPPLPFIIITQPEKRWYSFTIPHRVEGWVYLGTAGKVHTACAQGCINHSGLYDKRNCPQCNWIGPRTSCTAVRHAYYHETTATCMLISIYDNRFGPFTSITSGSHIQSGWQWCGHSWWC